MITLDVIIVVRDREESDLLSRLEFRRRYPVMDNVKFIVVDDGSAPESAARIKEKCESLRMEYVRLETGERPFNLSRGRNAGILASSADYVLFEDVDLFYEHNFYCKLISNIELELEENRLTFLVFPVIYLSEVGTKRALASDREILHCISEMRDAESPLIDFYAPVSSLIVCSRMFARRVGAFDEAFEGWGFEDSDFVVRILRLLEVEKPREFYRLDTRSYSDQVQWRGWRVLFRVFGDLMAMRGMYALHAWHLEAAHKSESTRARNRQIFLANCGEYRQANYVARPLWSQGEPSQLFISKNPHAWGLKQFEVFQNPIYLEETYLSPENIEGELKKYNVELVVMPNPYGREDRLAIYLRLKELGVRCIVVERGALPGSVYFDEGGFCAESESYTSSNWDTPLTAKQLGTVQSYLDDLRHSGASLEPQGGMIGGGALKRKLFGGSENVRVLFLALQSASDTTTNYFCGQSKTYRNFIGEVSRLPEMLPRGWVLAVKNHPLSIDKVVVPGAVSVDEYHVGDILEMCDATIVLNSGVGVLSIAYGKPVFCFGQAYYCFDRLAYAVSTSPQLVDVISSGLQFDNERAARFLYFLVEEFYSFATWVRKERSHTDVAKMSISVDIDYKVIRVRGRSPVVFPPAKTFDIRKSPLFDRYRLDDYTHRNKRVNAVLAENDRNSEVTRARSSKRGGGFSRKVRKLLRNPRAFFLDAVRNRVS